MDDDEEETRVAPIGVLIGSTLQSIGAALDGIPDSPRSRGLRMTAAKYERALETWAQSPPTSEQRVALRELVSELQAEVEGLIAGAPASRQREPR